jgi:hypothetical protein
MGVLSSKAEWSRVFVVNFVDVLIHGAPVEELVGCRRRECKPFVSGEGKKRVCAPKKWNMSS